MITRPYSKIDTDAAERQMKKLKARHSMLEEFFGLNQDKPMNVEQPMPIQEKTYGGKIKHQVYPEMKDPGEFSDYQRPGPLWEEEYFKGYQPMTTLNTPVISSPIIANNYYDNYKVPTSTSQGPTQVSTLPKGSTNSGINWKNVGLGAASAIGSNL